MFNLHGSLDLSSIDRTPATVSPLIRTIIRLWCHEVCRSFYDRLTSEKDKSLFSSTLNHIVAEHFCVKSEERTKFLPISRGNILIQTYMIIHSYALPT